ncbi:MAG TPA: CBS domain-containing protein [Chitinispirillaceae bacterium]|nr:CBS domain-containing protein [Chitinispirillaceae bacterium]
MHYKSKQFAFSFQESWLIFSFFLFLSFEQYFFSNKIASELHANSILISTVAVILFTISLLLHELGHLLAAKKLNLFSLQCYFFPYGSVYPENIFDNFDIKTILFAFAGPFASGLCALLWHITYEAGVYFRIPYEIISLLDSMVTINILIFAINLLPIYPLDGSIAVRTALIMSTGNKKFAFKSVVFCGTFFSVLITFTGVYSICKGTFIPGLWFIFTGILIYEGSLTVDNKQQFRNMLKGDKVYEYMRKNPITVPANLTLAEFVFEYIHRYQTEFFPVMANSCLIGSISSQSLKKVPSKLWQHLHVKDITELLSEENSVTPASDVIDALTIMCKCSRTRILVVNNGILEGVLSIKDLIKYLPVKDF